jgi:hypothetical protein
VCGSIILFNIEPYSSDTPYVEIDGTAVFNSYEKVSPDLSDHGLQCTFTAPTVANEECTIYYAYDA